MCFELIRCVFVCAYICSWVLSFSAELLFFTPGTETGMRSPVISALAAVIWQWGCLQRCTHNTTDKKTHKNKQKGNLTDTLTHIQYKCMGLMVSSTLRTPCLWLFSHSLRVSSKVIILKHVLWFWFATLFWHGSHTHSRETLANVTHTQRTLNAVISSVSHEGTSLSSLASLSWPGDCHLTGIIDHN